MALVVVGLPFGDRRLQRQQRRRTIQGLDLALLIDGENEGLVRRIQIEPDHIAQLFDEMRIPRELELLHPMGLEAVLPPDPLHRHA